MKHTQVQDKEAPMKTRVFSGIKTTASVNDWPFAVQASTKDKLPKPQPKKVVADKRPVHAPVVMTKKDKALKGIIQAFLDGDE